MADAKAPAASVHHVDEAWLAKRREDVIDPALPIIDPHHHFWRREVNYVLEELLADIDTGHNIVSTVFVECGAQYRTSGSEEMAPLGETEFVMGIVDQVAKNCESQRVRIDVAAGIVGFADLRIGSRVREVLEAQIVAGKGRFRGIRNMSVWDADPGVPRAPTRLPGREFLGTKPVREGLAQLAALDLSFDAWLLHPQIPELAAAADAVPDLTIVLNHIGGRIGTGHYANDRKAAFADWRKNMIELGKRPNVHIKVGGMGMSVFGFNFQSQPLPPSSEDLATAWRPLVETCIEAFGHRRCMFQGNFPADKAYTSYVILWNAFKRITQGASAAEKAALFHDTAADAYRL